MRKSRFTESQIVGILKELKAGVKAATICRKHGISGATLYNLRATGKRREVQIVRDTSHVQQYALLHCHPEEVASNLLN